MRNNTSWLQHIPKHWEIMRLKDVCELNPNPTDENIIGTVSFVPMESLRYDCITPMSIDYNEARGKYTYFCNEDLLIAKVTPCFENGNVAIAKDLMQGVGFGTSEIFVLRNNEKIKNRFLFYIVRTNAFIGQACSTMYGVGGLKRISPLFMRTASIPLPPLSEQEKIARYLDTKVGEIDQKVSLIEKKIERYQLLKKSIINKVVTKGLHPEAPLKDSQISWLGQIPEHWEVKRIKDIISLVFMGTSPSYEYEVENENYVFGQRNNQLYKIDFNGLKHATNEFFNSRSEYEYLTYGDVIINTLGGGSVGRVGYFDYLGDMRMITDGHVMILRSNSYSTKFLYYYLHSKRRELENLASGSTNQSFFNISDIVVLYLPAPPLSEQQEIASYLDQKCADIDAIIANCTAQIEKYKTLKRALINEVVTGQRTIE